MAEIEGTADVDGMLDRISPEQFRRWQAWFRLRREEDWEIAGTISSAAWNGAMVAGGAGEKALRVPDTWIPKRYLFERRKPRKKKPEPIQAVLAAAYGPKY